MKQPDMQTEHDLIQNTTTTDFLNNFPSITRYQFQFTLHDVVRLPAYSGSAWRGLLGHGLKRAVCIMRDTECNHCLLASGCVHAYLFESFASSPRARKRSNHIPSPYILHLGLQDRRMYEKGEIIRLELRLVGKANQYLGYVIHAFNLAGQLGIGRDKASFDVSKVKAAVGDDEWETLYANGEMLSDSTDIQETIIPPLPAVTRITLTTPLRIKHHGHFVNPGNFDLSHLFNSLARRLAEMGEYYGDTGRVIDWRDLLPKQPLPQATHTQLQWHDWTRYSSRQKSSMQMGGMIGHIDFEEQTLQPWIPLLWLGQWLHLGKSSSMGLGAYELNGNLAIPEKSAAKGHTVTP